MNKYPIDLKQMPTFKPVFLDDVVQYEPQLAHSAQHDIYQRGAFVVLYK